MQVVHGKGVFCGQEEVGALAVHVMGVFGGHVWVVVLVVHGMGRFCGQVDRWTGGRRRCGLRGLFVVLCKMIIFE